LENDVTALPSTLNPCWKEIAVGRRTANVQVLATKILLSRVVLSTKKDPSPENVLKAAGELRSFFEKNMATAGRDLDALLH
jgi:hypothetical protein